MAPMVARHVVIAWVTLAAIACSSESDAPSPPEPDPTFPYPLDDRLRFHHLQAKSTHNSYHVETPGNTILELSFSHVPLDRQFTDQGVRQVELDLRLDHDSGTFLVYHLPIVDEGTTCSQFTECLGVIKSWSDGHRAHHPIVVQIELKDGRQADYEAYYQQLHSEITSVWPEKRMITPRMVQGDYATLAEAVRQDGWPTLGEIRGRVMFTLNNGGEFRDTYTHGGQSLDGRLIFIESFPSDPFGAIAIHNDPVGEADGIAAAIAANMLVRTRADSGGTEARAGDTTRLEAALASGAHFVTTDFPAPVDGINYWVDIPNGTPTRCNPLTAPPECTSQAIEDPTFMGAN